MQAKPMPYVLGICLVAVMAAAGSSRSSSFEARTSGAHVLELRGSAEFGQVEEDRGSGAFVLTLGAEAPGGAVVFTWPTGTPRPSKYFLPAPASCGNTATRRMSVLLDRSRASRW